MVRIINIDTKTRTIRVSNEDKDIDWITVKGTHVPIKKGESKGEAVEKFFEEKQAPDELAEKLLDSGNYQELGKLIVERFSDGKKPTKQFIDTWMDDSEIWDPKNRNAIIDGVHLYLNKGTQESQSQKTTIDKVSNRLKDSLKTEFKNQAPLFGWNFNDISETDDSITFAVQDVGKWVVPEYYKNDPDYLGEDFSDWDWKEPSEDTLSKIEAAIEKVEKNNKGIEIKFSVQEKNYLYFTIKDNKNGSHN